MDYYTHSTFAICGRCRNPSGSCTCIPAEPARADLPASPSRAYAEGFREGWIAAWAHLKGET